MAIAPRSCRALGLIAKFFVGLSAIAAFGACASNSAPVHPDQLFLGGDPVTWRPFRVLSVVDIDEGGILSTLSGSMTATVCDDYWMRRRLWPNGAIWVPPGAVVRFRNYSIRLTTANSQVSRISVSNVDPITGETVAIRPAEIVIPALPEGAAERDRLLIPFLPLDSLIGITSDGRVVWYSPSFDKSLSGRFGWLNDSGGDIWLILLNNQSVYVPRPEGAISPIHSFVVDVLLPDGRS